MVDNYSNVKLALISKYDTFVWPRHVRWPFYTNVDSNVQLKVTATAVIIRKRGWFSRIPFCVLLCAFYNNSDAFLMPMTSLMIPQQPKINPFYIILYLLPLIFFFENGIRMEITFYLCWYWYLIQCISRLYAIFHNDIYSYDWLTNSIWVATLLNSTNDCAT